MNRPSAYRALLPNSERTDSARIPHPWLTMSVVAVAVLIGGATYRYVSSHHATHEIAAADLKTGDCFTAPSGPAGFTGTRVQQVSCDQPHNSQVYAEPAATESKFLGSGYVHSDANDACQSDVNVSEISMLVPAGYDLVDFYPDSASALAADKKFICVIEFPSDASRSFLATDKVS